MPEQGSHPFKVFDVELSQTIAELSLCTILPCLLLKVLFLNYLFTYGYFFHRQTLCELQKRSCDSHCIDAVEDVTQSRVTASIPFLRPFRRNVSQFEEAENCVYFSWVLICFSLLGIINLLTHRIPVFELNARKFKAKYIAQFQQLVQYLQNAYSVCTLPLSPFYFLTLGFFLL